MQQSLPERATSLPGQITPDTPPTMHIPNSDILGAFNRIIAQRETLQGAVIVYNGTDTPQSMTPKNLRITSRITFSSSTTPNCSETTTYHSRFSLGKRRERPAWRGLSFAPSASLTLLYRIDVLHTTLQGTFRLPKTSVHCRKRSARLQDQTYTSAENFLMTISWRNYKNTIKPEEAMRQRV